MVRYSTDKNEKTDAAAADNQPTKNDVKPGKPLDTTKNELDIEEVNRNLATIQRDEEKAKEIAKVPPPVEARTFLTDDEYDQKIVVIAPDGSRREESLRWFLEEGVHAFYRRATEFIAPPASVTVDAVSPADKA